MQLFSRVLVVHQSNLLCEMLRESLEHRNYSVLTYSTSGQEALVNSFDFKPDLVIVGNTLSGFSGVEVVEKLRGKGFEGKYLFLSQDENEVQMVFDRLNVDGHIHAVDGISELFFAIREIASGRQYVSANIEKQLYRKNKKKKYSDQEKLSLKLGLLEKLTKRELDVMKALSNSKTTPQIAKKFQISPATVNNHRANIIKKLNLSGRNKLMSYAISLKAFY